MELTYYIDKESPANLLVALSESQWEKARIHLQALLGEGNWQQDFTAQSKEMLFLYPEEGPQRLILLGLGKEATPQSLQDAAFHLVKTLGSRFEEELVLDLRKWSPLRLAGGHKPDFASAFARGVHLGAYDVGLLKTRIGSPDKKPIKLTKLGFWTTESHIQAVKKAAWRGKELAISQRNIMDLINLPGNQLYPEQFAEVAITSGEEYGYEVTILDKAAIEAEGMGALLGVNHGRSRPPAFIIRAYKPEGEEKKKVALGGKGVTFDTGGISLKPSASMYYMKSDMGGAAAVLGTMEVVARLKLPVHLIGIIPATDNMPGGNAIVPGDVLTSYSGITIEVEDTDAEGRLILADGLSYVIQKHEPEVVIDLATLTGASVFALGYHAAALFSQNDELAAALNRAGEASGERVWRLPLWDDYAKQLHSDVADIKNYGGRPAGAVTAAKFLEKFTHKHPAWAHLDIAGVAFGESGQSKGKSGTGFGPNLLLTYLESL
jgi:leucyl aminopeptidase